MASQTLKPRVPVNHFTVAVGGLEVATERGARIVTFGLGSCVAVTAYDPVQRVGGMLHYMLAAPPANGSDAERRPCLYGASGIPLLLQRMLEHGALLERLVVCAAGGAEVLQDGNLFAIGARNGQVLDEVLLAVGRPAAARDLGGHHARNLVLELDSGRVTCRCRGKEQLLWAP